MRRALVVLVLIMAAALATAGPVSAAAVVRVQGTVHWAVRWSIRWNNGSSGRGFDLDAGKVTGYGDLNLYFTCDGGPNSCSWWAAGSFWKRPARPSKAECKQGYETDDLGQRYRDLLYPTGPNSAGFVWAAPAGTWLCATTESRYARVRILHWPTKAELWFDFRYLTWER